jgi:hypothetical protein
MDSGRDKLTEAAHPVLEHQALVGQTSLSADWTEVPRKGSWACKVGGSSQTSALSATLGVDGCWLRYDIRGLVAGRHSPRSLSRK